MTLNTMYPPQKDSPSTRLQGDILATDTTFLVYNASVLPQTVPFPLTLGYDTASTEVVIVTAINNGTNQLTVTRSSGRPWPAETKVARVFNADDLLSVQQNIALLENRANQTGTQAISTITGLQGQIDLKSNLLHKGEHVVDGGDPFVAGDLLNAISRLIVKKDGVAAFANGRRAINLSVGNGLSLTITDDAANEKTDILFGNSRNDVCNGRLTLASSTPVADATAATILYFTPYNGNSISLYDGTLWNLYTFTELSLSLSGWTANKNNDIFIYNNNGTLTLERAEWTNDSTRSVAVTLQNGIYVKSGAPTRRYLGTIRTIGTTGQCSHNITTRFVWNLYNKEPSLLTKEDSVIHTYTGNAYRAWNNDTSQFVSLVNGLATNLSYTLWSFLVSSTSGNAVVRLSREGFTTNFLPESIVNYNTNYIAASCSSEFSFTPGYHTVNISEYANSAGGSFLQMYLNAKLMG